MIYSTTTASLLWPLPGAIRFDAAAVANRPGRHGLWQRPLERRRLRQAPLLLPSSAGALAEATAAVGGCDRARPRDALANRRVPAGRGWTPPLAPFRRAGWALPRATPDADRR